VEKRVIYWGGGNPWFEGSNGEKKPDRVLFLIKESAWFAAGKTSTMERKKNDEKNHKCFRDWREGNTVPMRQKQDPSGLWRTVVIL